MENSNASYFSFDSGINTSDRIYAHRGDIFVCSGVFKDLEEIDKDDHILAKPNRPVLIISNDEYNRDIVKILAFSTKEGTEHKDAINSYRSIKVPGIYNSNHTYIDVSQVFTINTHQLKAKLGTASQEIVDAAVALNTLQNINANSINTMIQVMKDKYPDSPAFQTQKEECIAYSIDNTRDPFEDVFTDVVRVPLEELNKPDEVVLNDPDTKEEAYELYQEWLILGTDLFRNKYHLSKQNYIAFRDKCVNKMLGKVSNFKKFDWST